jgi:UDP:flavonoid glycosyltransferase YjiC (YdhE family)
MRILFASTGGRGHALPLVPIARAAQAAGHTLAFASPPSIVSFVEALGFNAFPIGPGGPPPERRPLRPVDLKREEREFREGFAERGARTRATGVLELGSDWRPELVVSEETDFGSMIAAERLGVPRATVLVLAAGTFVRPGLVAEPLNEVRAEHGLPPDPELAMVSGDLVLSPFPPSFRDPAFPLPAGALSFRPSEVHDRNGPPAGTPTVYFTLGTVFNLECGDLFERVLGGLSELPVDVLASLGPQRDPEELGPLPDNIRVERFVPQSEIFARASAVVSHGGSGTVMGALAHGLPQVVIPMGADQPPNAARCEALGVARVLDPVTATPGAVREAVAAVLSDPAYRSAADVIKEEIAALPGPAQAVKLLERLAPGRTSGTRR